MCRRLNSKRPTISSTGSQPWWPDSNYSVSGKPGAVQFKDTVIDMLDNKLLSTGNPVSFAARSIHWSAF